MHRTARIVTTATVLLLSHHATAQHKPHHTPHTTCNQNTSYHDLKYHALHHTKARQHQLAHECLYLALHKVTDHLDALADEAKLLKLHAAAAKSAADADAAHVVDASGCLVDASGETLCLDTSERSARALAAAPPSLLGATDDSSAAAALSRAYASSACEPQQPACDAAPIEEALVSSAQSHWWEAARGAINLLRARGVTVSDETRRALTSLHTESGSLVALLRQTRLDEATIKCAVMWAQGARSVHLNVKFAQRLDAPVTVLNVDNEVVEINSTHVAFSGVGRQKPKRYVIDLELFGEIDANASSWYFGSVGTLRFKLAKKEHTEWPRLLRSDEAVKNHRVWLEKEEQVRAEEKKEREQEAAAAREREREQERASRDAAAAEAAAAARLRREAQLPHLAEATAAVDALASDADPAAFERTEAASAALLDAVGQASNTSAAEQATILAESLRSLGGMARRDLTAEAIESKAQEYKEWLTSLVEPEPAADAPPRRKKGSKKRKKPKGGGAPES